MDAVETEPFQNGARQYFGVNSEQDRVDAGVGGGVCFLLWGEPGRCLVWVWAALFGNNRHGQLRLSFFKMVHGSTLG
jgi:hypothetical protein